MIRIKIENWSITSHDDKYTPPEAQKIRLMGEVYGHPNFEEGHKIVSSHIVSIHGNTIETASGSVYELGTPDEGFVEWCKTNGCHVPTEDEPIKLKNWD